MSEADPLNIVKRLGESYSQIRLARGISGMTAYGMLALIGVWAIIAWRLSSDAIQDIALFAAGCLITGAYVWWTRKTHNFAERNPGLALLSGAELLEYQRFEAQVKGSPPVSDSPLVFDPQPPAVPENPAPEDQ
jgi:O-antigen ligase